MIHGSSTYRWCVCVACWCAIGVFTCLCFLFLLQYVKTRGDLEEAQMKKYDWEQEQIKHMKDYIARFGHGSAKLARQAQSKEKTLEKMERSGLTEKVTLPINK